MAQQREPLGEPLNEQPETFEVVGSNDRRTCRFDAEELNLSWMGLECIPAEIAWCTKLRKLNLCRNKIWKLERLPHSLHTLYISSNQIQKLEGLPDSLRTLYIGFNRIQKLERLPHSLHALNIRANEIRKLEGLPHSLHALEIDWNNIEKLEGLPRSLHTLDIKGNQIWKLQELPPYLEKICTSVRDPVVEKINSGRRAAVQRERCRREIVRDFLSCCPQVIEKAHQATLENAAALLALLGR